MASHWRRHAGGSANLPTKVLGIRDSTTTGTGAAQGASTIAPYSTSLNGVNQPMNLLFKDMMWWTLGIIALAILLIRLVEIGWSKLRQVSAMSVTADKQGYWKRSQWSWMPSLKKYIIYSPLWKKRHNREFKLSSAVSVGTLPSRIHAVILCMYLASNLAYMFILNWQNENKYAFCAELRGRSGTLALVNMVPLVILAGRNNPLIGLLKVSFDTYNLLHRWMGRMVVFETVVHAISWAIVQHAAGGWESINEKILHHLFIGSGFFGTLCMIFLVVLSLSPLRHAFYETFLNVHIILAFLTFAMTWVHCQTTDLAGGLPQLPWVMAIMALWFAERFARMFRMAYLNWSDKGFTEAVVEPMPAECSRVTLHLPRYLDVKPGQHAYLRFPRVNGWESHPFSIAWVEHMSPRPTDKESHLVDREDSTTSVSFVIAAQTGFTRKLYETALASGLKSIRLRAIMEGPYAGHHDMDSYGHAVLFAGSTGITHQISFIRYLIEGRNAGIVATRRVTLVWIVRDYEALEWVRPWMDVILRLPHRKDILRIQLFITRPKNPREIVSASTTVQMFPGRPNIPLILGREVSEQVGAMCVTVCGPGALADDVRDAVRQVQDRESVVDFVEESFTW
jgi:hypothetical protein